MAVVKSKASWISKSFGIEKQKGKNTFTISGISIEQIVKEIPPPFYIYDTATIKNQYKNLHAALTPHGIDIYYSVKVNTSLAIVKGMHAMGAGLETASLGELIVAQKIGADPKRLSFAGPVKTDEELSLALDMGIDTINVESEREFQRINEFARKKGIKQKVGIRVNPPMEVEGAGVVMGGGPKKFGTDVEQIDEKFIKRILSLSNIELAGVHVFAATQILNTEAFLLNIKYVCEIAQKLNQYFPVRYVNFGGGLGIPYTEEYKELPLDEISKSIGKMLQRFPFLQENNIALCVEPGRFFVGQSGIYVVKVDNVKMSRGKRMILVDGGIQHMLRPALSLGHNKHTVYNLSNIDKKADQQADIGGSLCTSLDFLATDVLLPETNPGDLLGIFSAGAHGWSEAMTYYLSHPTAAEVLIGNGTFAIIRKSEHPREFLKNQLIPKENMF